MTKPKGSGKGKSPEPRSQKETLKHAGSLKGKTDLITCPLCRGSGKRGDRVCTLCDGDKQIRAHR